MGKLEADIIKTGDLMPTLTSVKLMQRGWLTESKRQGVSRVCIGLVI